MNGFGVSRAGMNVLRSALSLLVVLSVITGLLYPLAVTGIGELLFPVQARGSLIEIGGKTVGSALIGQHFADPKYFWGRPSATGSYPYNANASAGSNLGPLNSQLIENIRARADALRAADPDNRAPIPVDLVTASGSGLDPHISPAAAKYQAARVARVRGIEPADVAALIAQNTEDRQFGIFGEPRVNVLELNLALDKLR